MAGTLVTKYILTGENQPEGVEHVCRMFTWKMLARSEQLCGGGLELRLKYHLQQKANAGRGQFGGGDQEN